jgi:hypothetical protein
MVTNHPAFAPYARCSPTTAGESVVTKEGFLRTIQHRAARLAVGASATRGPGTSGVGKSARGFLARLNLAQFGTNNQHAFMRTLDRTTKRLQRKLPKRGRSWGLARKLLTIFLRDSLYTGYLSRAYGLGAAERFLEIPLDSITAHRIREKVPELPPWPRVRHASPEISAQYQAAALRLARKQRVSRVHLDAYWWGQRRERY